MVHQSTTCYAGQYEQSELPTSCPRAALPATVTTPLSRVRYGTLAGFASSRGNAALRCAVCCASPPLFCPVFAQPEPEPDLREALQTAFARQILGWPQGGQAVCGCGCGGGGEMEGDKDTFLATSELRLSNRHKEPGFVAACSIDYCTRARRKKDFISMSQKACLKSTTCKVKQGSSVGCVRLWIQVLERWSLLRQLSHRIEYCQLIPSSTPRRGRLLRLRRRLNRDSIVPPYQKKHKNGASRERLRRYLQVEHTLALVSM